MSVKWHTDSDNWFLDVKVLGKFFRFSSMGYVSGRNK